MLLDPSIPVGRYADTALENLSLPINQPRRGTFRDGGERAGERVPIKEGARNTASTIREAAADSVFLDELLRITRTL